MKITTILPLAAACLAGVILNSCATDPEYAAWKKNNQNNNATANPYGVPQAGGETGSYTPSTPATPTTPGAAPYQPLPGVAQPGTPPAPVTQPSAPAAPITGATTHTVVTGDSLWGLARQYGTTIEAIQAANGLTTTTIRTGQQLTIPGR